MPSQKRARTNKELQKSAGDDMLASKSKLSTFAAANRTITAACQAMKNTKGQEHQSERDKKVPTTTKR